MQLIEVRLINPSSNPPKVLADEFTQASTHREAIELALDAWSGGVGTLKSMEQEGEGKFVKGNIPCWRYIYYCVLEDPEDKEHGRVMYAILFAQYKEREQPPISS